MEDLVVVKSTSIVHPRNVVNQSDRVKKVHLTPWDLLRLRSCYPQRGLFFLKPDLDIDVIISKLKTSLSITLDHFYPLAGRLVKKVNENDDTVSFYVRCDGGHGVKFVHAVGKTIVVSDLVKSGFVDRVFGSLFFPATGIKNYQGVSNPLLVIQVTEIKDGVFISFGYNHTVADGKSMWSFINVWSEICSKDTIGISPCLRGWFLDGIEYPIHIKDPEMNQPSNGTSNVVQELVFRLTKENVLKLKAKANEETGFELEDATISSFQAVLGHIWRLRVKHSGMSREEEAHCSVPIDMRGRLNPKLKEECFGNVVQTGIAKGNVGEMLDHGLGWTALQLNRMVRSQTDENAKALAENWVKNGERSVAARGTLFVTSCPRFNVYGNDFGWGKPIGLRTGPPSLSDGRLVVFQAMEEGGCEFQACFPPQVVFQLLSDVEFLKYVDIAS